MLKYRIDILDALREKGYSSYRIRDEKLIGQAQLQKIREGRLASDETLNTICCLLNCQPGDILEYVPDPPEVIEQKRLAKEERRAKRAKDNNDLESKEEPME